MNSNAQFIINQIDSFPSLPSTVSRVMEITGDPESSAEDLMKVLLVDQSMCTTLLKIANSAFFGLPRQIDTIEKAVMVLGFDEIRNIVLGKAVFNSFNKIHKGNRERVEHFWYHTFICGLAGKIIAEDCRLSASEFFIAGLIHDIGKLAMLMSLDGDYTQILEITGITQINSHLKEKELFSISHDEVGARLLNRWLFPETLLSTVRHHHLPKSAEKPFPSLIIQIADILSHLHNSSEPSTSQDDFATINNFIPEIGSLLNRNGLDWNIDLLVRWQEALKISSERDGAILTIITS